MPTIVDSTRMSQQTYVQMHVHLYMHNAVSLSGGKQLYELNS